MAQFRMNGMDSLEATLEDLASLNDEERTTILSAGAQAIADKLKETLEQLGLKRSGQLISGVGFKISGSGDSLKATIAAYGKRKSEYRGIRKTKTMGKVSRTNGQVLALLENGTPRMAPRYPVETAYQQSQEVLDLAIQTAWNEIVDSKL